MNMAQQNCINSFYSVACLLTSCINRKILKKYEDMNLSKPFQMNLPHAKKKYLREINKAPLLLAPFYLGPENR